MRGRKKIGTQWRQLSLANTKSSKGPLRLFELAGALTFSLYFKLAHHYPTFLFLLIQHLTGVREWWAEENYKLNHGWQRPLDVRASFES